MENKSGIRQFMAANGISYEQINFENYLTFFLDEMSRGLRGRASSLAMLPTYIEMKQEIPQDEAVVVLDAGGTNLRVARVIFNQGENPVIDYYQKYPMPGIDREISGEEFFRILAEYLQDMSLLGDRIGFCFSYPVEMTPEKDGKLLHWSKEIEIKGLEGSLIGAGLMKALKKSGWPEKKIVLLNDATATLLAGKAAKSEGYSSYLGFVLGTGTNSSYPEDISQIEKLSKPSRGQMIINVESGSFNGIPQGLIDREFDRSLQEPGSGTFEKMLSGGYLGDLVLAAIKKGTEHHLFSIGFARQIQQTARLKTSELDDFLRGALPESDMLAGALIAGDASDARVLREIIESIIDRAAFLAALNLTALVIKTGVGRDASRPVLITAEGTTLFQLKGFQEKIRFFLDRNLTENRGLHYELIQVDHAVLIGSALAALTD